MVFFRILFAKKFPPHLNIDIMSDQELREQEIEILQSILSEEQFHLAGHTPVLEVFSAFLDSFPVVMVENEEKLEQLSTWFMQNNHFEVS